MWSCLQSQCPGKGERLHQSADPRGSTHPKPTSQHQLKTGARRICGTLILTFLFLTFDFFDLFLTGFCFFFLFLSLLMYLFLVYPPSFYSFFVFISLSLSSCSLLRDGFSLFRFLPLFLLLQCSAGPALNFTQP